MMRVHLTDVWHTGVINKEKLGFEMIIFEPSVRCFLPSDLRIGVSGLNGRATRHSAAFASYTLRTGVYFFSPSPKSLWVFCTGKRSSPTFLLFCENLVSISGLSAIDNICYFKVRNSGLHMECTEDELGLIPRWNPSARHESESWLVTSHYFASYAPRHNSSDTDGQSKDKGNRLFPTTLVAVVNRYIPKSASLRSPNEGGLTLVLAHSLGLHKEIWEPVLSHLLHLDEESKHGRLVSEIWSFEPLHHGDAAILNKDGLPEVDSMNYPVDLVEFIRRRMPEKWDPKEVLSTHLPRHEVSHRPNVVGIGHSIGGTSFIHANLQIPKTLSSLIVIEPFLVSPEKNLRKAYAMVSAGTARQPDNFPSKEALLKYMKKNQAYSDWDPQVVDVYIKFGTYENGDGRVFLKTKRSTEAQLILNRYMFEAVWFCLPSMPVHVHFIYANYSWIMSEHSRAQTRVQPPLASSSDVDAGHATIQEAPHVIAKEVFEFLVQHYAAVEAQKGVSSKL